jgi:hypothetical protein
MIEERTFCAIDEITPIADKQTRAQSIQARMALGKVRFPKFAAWYPAARDQLLKFPHGAHDDFVDALAYIGLGLNKMAPSRYVSGKRRDTGARPGSLAWVKAQSNKERRDRAMQANVNGW